MRTKAISRRRAAPLRARKASTQACILTSRAPDTACVAMRTRASVAFAVARRVSAKYLLKSACAGTMSRMSAKPATKAGPTRWMPRPRMATHSRGPTRYHGRKMPISWKRSTSFVARFVMSPMLTSPRDESDRRSALRKMKPQEAWRSCMPVRQPSQ